MERILEGAEPADSPVEQPTRIEIVVDPGAARELGIKLSNLEKSDRLIAEGISSGMTLLLVGIGVLGSVLGLFYLKGRLENPRLARLAYSEFVMRLTVIAVVLIVIGVLLMLNRLLF